MKIEFKRSYSIKIELNESQVMQISSPENIIKSCKKENVIAFDIFYDNSIIGFAMLINYELGKWFLWNYAIDKKYQGIGLGEKSLIELISLMKKEYGIVEMSTTYIFANDVARNLYTKLGFKETGIINEADCHEVNMILTV